MSPRRRTCSSRDGLFDWTDPDAGDVQAAEVRPNPLLIACRAPGCGAGPRQPCTRATRQRGTGGHRDRAPHDIRVQDANQAAAAAPTITAPEAEQAVDARTDRS